MTQPKTRLAGSGDPVGESLDGEEEDQLGLVWG